MWFALPFAGACALCQYLLPGPWRGWAAALALESMAAERDDLERYVDLFGAHPKYGVSGRRISSVTYRAQPYERVRPLYELA